MSKNNDDFFVEKKAWSQIKDELLGCYFKPYLTKILKTFKPVVYIDCFAGKGKFDDGKDGSPLIALKIIKEVTSSVTKVKNPIVKPIFIEPKHEKELRENIQEYPNAMVLGKKYEDAIETVLSDKKDCSVFLYIDPYGIKSLRCSFFDSLSNGLFPSIELLINMNSFGFFREACRALGTSFEDEEIFGDLIEYEPMRLDKSDKSIKILNEIAGFDCWQQIVRDYKLKKIDGYSAEERISEMYCKRLRNSYKYVLNMPIRIKCGQRPKYRLVHATNHSDGCLLMVENICKRWEVLQKIQNDHQMVFWEENINNMPIEIDYIKAIVIKHFQQCTHYKSLHDVLADFFVNNGIVCSTKTVRDILKELEEESRIEVKREPALSKTGKTSTFMLENKKQKVSIRWIK